MTHPRLCLGLTQRIHVGIEVRKALHLLQLPGVELQAELERELMENPCLEIDDGDEEPGLPAERTRGERLYDHGARREGGWEDRPEREIPAPPEDLGSHLRRQIALRSGLGPEARRAAEHWIGSLDERGFVAATEEEVAGQVGVELGVARAAWAVVRSLDPAGVGARDLPDALRLQLDRRFPEDRVARRLVDEAWDLLPRGTTRVSLALGLPASEVVRAVRTLARLSPRPGLEFDPEPVRAIWPDLLVREVDGRFHVSIEEACQPRVRWSSGLATLRSDDPEVSRFLGEKRRAARWILRALQKRRRTLVLVTEAIVSCQEGFFRRGPEALRPLTLREIGGVVGLHESTVARVTQDKHADTPRGILPLRYFFSGRVRTVGAEDTAARAVKERIREIVREETAGSPVSDQRIAELLTYEGIRIARRTVAKYRVQLGIPCAQLRGLAIPAA